MWAQSAFEVGKIIMAGRRHRGLTQAALAKAVGTTQAWISEVEQGKDTAQIGKILRVLSYLGVRLRIGAAPWLKPKPSSRSAKDISLANIIASHSNRRGRSR